MTKKISIVIGMTLCLLVLPAVASAGYNVSGYIINPYTGEGVQYVCVVLPDLGIYRYTNATGYYSFTNLSNGTYAMHSCIAIFQCNTTSLVVNGAIISNFNVSLSHSREKATDSDKAELLGETAFKSLMESFGVRTWEGQYGEWNETGGAWTWGEGECIDQSNKTINIFDWALFSGTIAMPFTAIMGNVFFVFLFGMPFLAQWLRQENMIVPCVTGIILGAVLIGFLPVEFHLMSVLFIGICITGILYIGLKERS